MDQIRNILLGFCIAAASLSGCANGVVLAGKNAQDAFGDLGVVKLLAAVTAHNAPRAKHLVASGVNVNAVGEGGITPLLWVVLKRDTDAIKLLLDLGADPNEYVLPDAGKTGFGPPLWMAAHAGQREIVEILLRGVRIQTWPWEGKALL